MSCKPIQMSDRSPKCGRGVSYEEKACAPEGNDSNNHPDPDSKGPRREDALVKEQDGYFDGRKR